MKRIVAALVLLAIALCAHAEPPNATRVDMGLADLDMSMFGGPAAVNFGVSILLPDSAPDLAGGGPLATVSQFAGPVTFTVDGNTSVSAGWLQLELQNLGRGSPHSEIVLTAPFAGFLFPVHALNAQLSGIELHLIDDIGAAPSSTAHAELPADLGNFIDRVRLFVRVGGWGAGTGDFREFTGDLTAQATVSASATRVSVPIPEPAHAALLLGGLAVLAWRRRVAR